MATAELYRETAHVRKRQRKAVSKNNGDKEEAEEEDEHHNRRNGDYKLEEEDRAILRTAWTGALKTGERLWGGAHPYVHIVRTELGRRWSTYGGNAARGAA